MNLLSWAGREIKGGLQTVNRDIIHPVQQAFTAAPPPQPQRPNPSPIPAPLPQRGQPGFGVVRPGANVAPQRQFSPQQVAQFRHQPIPQRPKIDPTSLLRSVENIVKSPVQPIINAAKSNYDYGRGAVGAVTGNRVARDNGIKAGNKDIGNTVDIARQFTTRPVVQLATSVAGKQLTVAPTNPVTKAIIGNTPVQNIEKGVASTYQNHPNLPTWQRAALAGAYGAGQLAQDVPVAAGAVRGVAKAVDVAAPAVRDAAAVVKPMLPNEAGAIPLKGGSAADAPKLPGKIEPSPVDPQRALNTIHDYQDVLQGNKPSATVANISPELSQRIQKEAGVFVKPNTTTDLSKGSAIHIEQRHGINSPDPNPINDKAIGEMPYVLENPDRIIRGATVRGAPRVRLERQLSDNRVGVVEIIKKGNGANVVTYFNDSPSGRPGVSLPQDIRPGRNQSANTTILPNDKGFVKLPGKGSIPAPELPKNVTPNAEQRVFESNPMNHQSGEAPRQSSPVHVGPVAENRVQNLDRLEAQGGRAALQSPENSQNPLPIYNTKNVPLRDKAFRSTRSIIERQGEHGKTLGGMLQGARDTEEIYQAQIAKQIPTVRSLKGKAFENFVNATQGTEQAASPKIEQAVREWQAVHPAIRNRAVAAGLDVGDLGPKYYPHFIDYEKVFKDKNTYNQAINHLVQTGQAKTPEEAVKLLGYARDTSRNRSFGNLEAQRLIDLPFYDKTPNSLVSYLSGSTKRIAQTETFGKQDENALKLITKAGAQGYDTQAMKDAYDIAVGAKRYNQNATKMSNSLRAYQSTTRLGLGALTNATQNINTGIVTGHLRTMGAMLKQLDPKTRSFVQDTGTISDAVLNDLKTQAGFVGKGLSKITAPGFASVEKFNRSVAATAGRDYALRLAQKGDEATLRKLGVTGEIKDGTLNASQQIQAARKVVEKTQFKVDAQDLPGWADSPGGKLVSQFRTFSYAQGKFFSNEILKPAAKGNLLPLSRLLASLPVGYAMYEAKRQIAGRSEEPSKGRRGIEAFGNTGGAGLAVDIFRGLVPLNGKYLTPDRFTSMAAGTLGGPTVGGAVDAAGAAVQTIQKKNLPANPSDLNGKAAIVKGNGYYDATTAARFGLRQIPVVGTAIQNRVLPYAPKSSLTPSQQEQLSALPKNEQAAFQKKAEALNQQKSQDRQQTNVQAYKDSQNGVTKPKSVSSTGDQIKLGAKEPTKGIYQVKAKDGSTKYATLQGSTLRNFANLDEAKQAQAKNIFKYSKQTTTTINNEMYHKSSTGTVVKGAPPVPSVGTSTTVYDPKSNTWTKTSPVTGKVTKIDANGAQTVVNPGIGSISNARPDYVTNIRQLAGKYNVDPQAAMAVAAAEGLGGGVGDNGTSFGPFQLHVGGALPQGKDQAWAESPAGIEYAMQQISKVAGGKKGQDAINAIVNGFEKPLDPNGEVAKAIAVYTGSPIKLAAGQAKSGKVGTSSAIKAAATALASSPAAVKLRYQTHLAAPKIANPQRLPVIKKAGMAKPTLKSFTPAKYTVAKSGKISRRKGVS